MIKEPIAGEAEPTTADVGLRLVLGVRGVWQPQTGALFDIRIINLLVHGTTMLGRDWNKGVPLDCCTVHQVDGSVHSIEGNSSLKVL